MKKVNRTSLQIMPLLREVDVGKKSTVREVYRKFGIQEHPYYYWRTESGGMIA